ncbi:MAG: glycosyltransferase [Methylotenera sp.]|jgi:glycosyltransferase involved in cell wall biosynthesis|nr:glycosyltransferase [Methylotenera sp.]MDO9389338.1 glycosyltransferase [Methylotenera sp.]
MISILMPIKNEALYIESALKSIFEIDECNFEVIVVDDGSTDNSILLLKNLNYPFVRIIETDGIGKAAAFSLAYERALGDYFILLAGDDLLVASALKDRVIPLRSATPETPTITFCKLKSFSETKAYDGMILPKNPNKGLESGGCMAFNKAFGDLVFPIPSMLANEDSWLVLHARYLPVTVIHVPIIGLMYRIHANNSYKRGVEFAQVNEQMWLRQRALFYFYETYKEKLLPSQQRELLVEFCLQLLRYLGYPLVLLFLPRAPIKNKIKFFFNATPYLYLLRERFYKFFSGR